MQVSLSLLLFGRVGEAVLTLSSILTLLAITVDHFLVLAYPLSYRALRTHRLNRFIIYSIWIFATLIGSLELTEFLVYKWRFVPQYCVKVMSVLRPMAILIPLLTILFLWGMITRIALKITRSTRFTFRAGTFSPQIQRRIRCANYLSITKQPENLITIRSSPRASNLFANKSHSSKEGNPSFSNDWKAIKIWAIIISYASILSNHI